jgi:uncharacterized protein (TIGR03083 family)
VKATGSKLELARDWYLSAVEAVPPDGWAGATLCAGWTPSNVVAHVATGDQLFRAVIMDATGRDRSGQDLPVDFADRKRRFEELSQQEPAVIKAAAHRESEQTVALILEAVEQTPDTLVNVPFGRVPVNVARALRLNEYIIHGHDLAPAIGKAAPAPQWFSDRALGDAITMMGRLHQRSPHKGKSATFHIHRTDGEGEWTLRAEGGEAVAETGHGKADAAFRGPGEGLYWLLMGRGRPEDVGVEVHGDPAVAAAFKEWFPGP